MKGDFSRLTFHPQKQFTRVLLQQGRVALDADWNEQAAMLLHYLERLAVNLVGRFGGPENASGFEIKRLKEQSFDLSLGRGPYFVEGLLVENLEENARYSNQPYLPAADKLPADLPFLVYLDVWERHVSHLEDDSIREVALGGPDTATRAKLVWQVRATKQLPEGKKFPDTAEGAWTMWDDWVKVWYPPNRGILKARARPSGDPTKPCVASPDPHYRGLENQLYRVEIHTPGTAVAGATAGATFKWSRDNGSVAFAIADLTPNSESKTTTVTLEHLGHDDRQSLAPEDWVEIVDDGVALVTGPGPLLQLDMVDAGRAQVTLRGTPDTKAGMDKTLHPLLRRWDYGRAAGAKPAKDGALPVVEGTEREDHWIDLEDGIQISFQPAATGQPAQLYRSGDFWLIPARTATGDVEWPVEPGKPGKPGEPHLPKARPPYGVRHRFAPLALLPVDSKPVVNLRKSFKLLAQ